MKDKLTRRGSMHHFGRSELKVDLVLPPRQHHSQPPGTSGSELIRHREHRQQNMPPSPNANHLQSGSNLHGSNLLDEGSRLATDDVTDDVAADIASLSKTYANDTTNQHIPPALQHTLNSAFGMHRFGYTTTGTSPADAALEKNALVRHRHRLVTKKRTSSKSLIQGPLGGRKAPKKLTRRRSVAAGSTKNPDGNNSTDSQTDLSQGSNMLGRRSLRRARSMGDITSVTVDGLVEELNEFYSDALRNPLTETTDEAVSTPSPLEVADILRRESVRFHPAIVSNIRLLWNTSRRQYGKGFGFGQYVIICRKLLMAVVGGDAFKSIGRRDVFDQLVEDWKIDSGSKQNFLTFEQFWKAMYQMIDTWAPGLGSEVRIEWFDKIVSKILYQDAAGTTFFVEDNAVNDSAQRARLEKNTHKSQLRHTTASATLEHGRPQ